ncbi:MAG: hypothetical protein U1F71_20985 [Verrucomicrobiaceae bacterium]
MKASLLLLFALLSLTQLAAADQSLVYPEKDSLISFSVPDNWKAEFKDESLFVTPPGDESVIIEVMEMEAGVDDAEGAIKEAKATMDDFKNMKYDEIQKGETNGLGIMILNAQGEDADGKANINLVLLSKPGLKNFILLSCISSQVGSEKHGAAIGSLLGSLKAR